MIEDIHVIGGKDLPSKFTRKMPIINKEKWASMSDRRKHVWQIIALHPELKIDPNIAITTKDPNKLLQNIRAKLNIKPINSVIEHQ